MSKEITPNQKGIVESIINEFIAINKKHDVKKGKKSVFDLSDIVTDIKAKQKAVDENKALEKVWTKEILKQMDLDVKKLNKALKPLGFFAETHNDKCRREKRTLQDYKEVTITHSTNTYSPGHYSPLIKYHFDLEYCISYNNSKRQDLKTPCGFFISARDGRHSSDQFSIKTIELAMEHDMLKTWIKKQYEDATLRK